MDIFRILILWNIAKYHIITVEEFISVGVQFLRLTTTAGMWHGDGTLPDPWITPTWVWRHGIPNETKYIWSEPLTEHKTRQISMHAQWNDSVYNFIKSDW